MNIKKEKLVSLGLSDELADKVIDELKTAEKAELKGNGTSITQYEEQIAQLKQQISDNQAEYEANIAKIKLDNAIDNALTKSGVKITYQNIHHRIMMVVKFYQKCYLHMKMDLQMIMF